MSTMQSSMTLETLALSIRNADERFTGRSSYAPPGVGGGQNISHPHQVVSVNVSKAANSILRLPFTVGRLNSPISLPQPNARK